MRVPRAILAAICLAAAPNPASANIDEELAEFLRIAVDPRSGASERNLLRGLRELRDQNLRPLFGALAGSTDPYLRQEGILGLALLEDPPRINELMIAAIDSPVERARLIAAAFQESLLTPDQINAVLSWAGGDPAFEVIIRSWLLANTGDIDTPRVEKLAQSDEPRVAALASTLLAQAGETPRVGTVVKTVRNIESPVERGATIVSILTMIRTDKMIEAAPIAVALSDIAAADQLDPMLPLATLLTVAPAEAVRSWNQQFNENDSVGHRLRLAMTALETWETAPPEIFDTLIRSDQRELFPAIGACGRALASGEDPTAALSDLIAQRHAPSSVWAIRLIATRDRLNADHLARHVIRVWTTRDQPTVEDLTPVVLAAEMIAPDEPHYIRQVFDRALAAADEPICRALLIGVSRADAPAMWAPDSRWPSETCVALAQLIEASQSKVKLTDERAQTIAAIARGFGELPDAYRLQAAWIALRHDGTARELLSRVLAPDDI